MAMIFKGKYPQLYESLKDEKMVLENQTSLSASVEEIDSELAGIVVMLDELCGEYAAELKSSIASITSEAKVICDSIINGLEGALQEVQDLSSNLGDFKKDDASYEKTSNKLEEEKNKINLNNMIVGARNGFIHSTVISKLDALNKKIKAIVNRDKENCDDNITNIENFNDSIVDMRLKMASIASLSTNEIDPEKLAAMTPEEREEYVKKIVEKMTVKYNEYKKEYENYYNMMIKDQDGLNSLLYLYNSIMNESNSRSLDFSGNTVTDGFMIIDFITNVNDRRTSDGRTFLQCLEDYRSGKNWIDSGLGELYRSSRDNGMGFTDEDYEEEFLEDINWYCEYPVEDLMDYAIRYGKTINAKDKSGKTIMDHFTENYENAVKVGVAIQGLKELQGHARYDSYYLNKDFKDFNGKNWENDDSYIRELKNSGKIDINKLAYMSQSEAKIFKYICEKEGIDAAKEYMDSINTTLNRREGFIKASVYYSDLMSGNNEGLEAAWDHVKIGATGYGDGVSYFLDGFVDIVAPSREMSADEYAQVALLGYLTEGGTNYDSSLLTTYNIGKTAGEETIPTILNLVKPGLGKTAKVFSKYGNSVEDYFRADESTTSADAHVHAAVDMARDQYLGVIGDAVDSPGAKMLFSIFKSAVKDVTNRTMNGKDIDLASLYTSSDKAIKDNIVDQASSYISTGVTDAFNNWIDSVWPGPGGKAVKTAVKLFASPMAKENIKSIKSSETFNGTMMDPYFSDNYFGNASIGHEADFAP